MTVTPRRTVVRTQFKVRNPVRPLRGTTATNTSLTDRELFHYNCRREGKELALPGRLSIRI